MPKCRMQMQELSWVFCRALDPSCPSRVSSSFAVLSFVSSCPEEGATHSALSEGKEWTLFSCCNGGLPGASHKQSCKCIYLFRCFKTQHCLIHFFPRQYGTIGWQRLLIGYSRSTRQPPALYQPLAWGLLQITHLAT